MHSQNDKNAIRFNLYSQFYRGGKLARDVDNVPAHGEKIAMNGVCAFACVCLGMHGYTCVYGCVYVCVTVRVRLHVCGGGSDVFLCVYA